MITRKQLKPGEQIIQEKLAEKLGISRTPIRKALSQLVKEHLVKMEPRGSTYVREFSKEEITVVFEIRKILEGLACREAAFLVKKEELEYHKSLYQKAIESINSTDWRAYKEADVKFHFFVIKTAGKFLQNIIEPFHILSHSFIPGLIRPPKETFPEHMAIIDALGRHDSQEAEDLMRKHTEKTIAVLKELSSEDFKREIGKPLK